MMEAHLTQQQVGQIAAILAPTEYTAKAACAVIRQVEREYKFAKSISADFINIQQHARNLISIEATATKLLGQLLSEPLLFQLVAEKRENDAGLEDKKIYPRIDRITELNLRNEKDILRLLDLVKNNAAELNSNPENLRNARLDPNLEDAHKSLERRLIWVPVLHFCTLHKIKLSFYEQGSLFRALSKLHEVIGAPVLKVGSLRRAIEEYVHEPSILDEGEYYEWRLDT